MNAKELQKSLPPDLRRAVSGYSWRQNNIGHSSARVFRLEAENRDAVYLKIDARFSNNFLRQEKQKLDWLRNQLPVPKVLLFAEDETNEYLLLSEIPGIAASDDSLKENIPQTIEQLANALRTIHRVPTENCPFETRLTGKIEAARARMAEGLVDEADFDEERLGRTAEDLFREVLRSAPPEEDLVFTHGDYCAPNIILRNGFLSGFVDLAGAGVADRYQDIALLTRSVRYNFGEKWEEKAFEFYGIKPDWKKIHFYRLLDEFF